MTLKELVLAYDAKLLNDWDHTAMLAASVSHLQYTVCSLVKKPKGRMRDFFDYHPYRKEEERKQQTSGVKITPQNIGTLKMIATALARG